MMNITCAKIVTGYIAYSYSKFTILFIELLWIFGLLLFFKVQKLPRLKHDVILS